MRSIEEIKLLLAEHKEEMRHRYGVKEIGIFGSFVRGEERPGSDVDILVDFEKPVGFFTFLRLEEYLGKVLGLPVDLVTRDALKPHIGRHVLEEVIPV